MPRKVVAATLVIAICFMPNLLVSARSVPNAQSNRLDNVYGRYSADYWVKNIRQYFYVKAQAAIEEGFRSEEATILALPPNGILPVFTMLADMQARKLDILRKSREWAYSPSSMFHANEFKDVSKDIANDYNDYLQRQVFSATDFIPKDSDIPKSRDVTTDVAARNHMAALGVNIDQIPVSERGRYLAIEEYVRNVFPRAVRERLNVRAVTQPAPTISNSGNSTLPQIRADAGDFETLLERNRVPGNLTGVWEGTYTCGQGSTNFQLLITQGNTSDVNASFQFSANKNNSSVALGLFRMTGSYDNRTNKIVLKATKWVIQPAGYVTVDLFGKVSEGETRISGEAIDSKCSTFILERQFIRL